MSTCCVRNIKKQGQCHKAHFLSEGSLLSLQQLMSLVASTQPFQASSRPATISDSRAGVPGVQTRGSAKPGAGDRGGGSVSGAQSASDGERLTLWQDQGQPQFHVTSGYRAVCGLSGVFPPE